MADSGKGSSTHKSRRDESEEHRSSSRKNRRSASPARRRNKDSDKDSDSAASNDDSPRVHSKVTALGAQGLTEGDYYQRSAEYRHWLLHSGTARSYRKDYDLSSSRAPPEGGIYLDELTSKQAHRLFAKFCNRWNDGRLSDDYYTNKITSSSSLSSNFNTGFKWKFAGNRSDKERDELERAKYGVDSMTNSDSRGAREAREIERGKARKKDLAAEHTTSAATGANANAKDSGWGARKVENIGPKLPSTSVSHPSDARFEQEEAREAQRRASQAVRRAQRRDARDIEEERNPRATGREAVVEKRRERNRDKREFEAQVKGDGDVHVSETDLMGGDDSFQAA